MSMKCELTGKKYQSGNNVSHARNRTKRRFLPNLQNISFLSEKLGKKIQLRVATSTIRTVEKNENEVQTRKLCVDCSVVIPPDRLSAVPNTLRCTKCQSKYPIAAVRANEGIAGTREDYHRMRGQVFGGIRSRNHEL